MIIAGRGKEERGAFEYNVLVRLLLDHSAEFVLVGEDDREGVGLSHMDQLGSAT